MTTPTPLPDTGPTRRILLIGRAPGNDIVLKSPGVSARHARVLVAGARLVLEDLGSRNGTFVGSPPRRIDRAEIALGEPLTFGDTLLPVNALRDALERTRPQATAEAVHLDEAAVVTFGRGARASVAVDRPLASAVHASVMLDHGRVVVRDLGSTTGTFVDGRRIDRPVEIGPGSLVQIADCRYRLSSDGRTLEPVDTRADAIEVTDVAVAVPGSGGRPGRRILEGVSLVIEPGELVAVMGPSGSGKSTLLSVVNGQAVPAAGRVLVGGLDLHDHFELFRGRIGFVPQDDILHADLTVWQALWYAARLRLPADTSDAEIATRLRSVIAQLGLDGTEQTRVGDQRKRGVSGGQRKRVNLAMELLTDPPILVLDEPTSGLSSTDALSVIELLRSLADAGKTIIVTIHQPSLDAFRLFDAVAVIARDDSTSQVGRLAFFGRAWPDSVEFFEPTPADGPAPTNVDGLLRGLGRRPVVDWIRAWEGSAARSIWVDGRASGQAAPAAARRRPRPRPVAAWMQWRTLVARSLAVKAADGWNTAVLLLQAPLVAGLIAAVFARVLRQPATLASWPRTSLDLATTMFVTALAAIWFGCSSTAREIVNEWPVYRRERMVGLSIPAYLGSKFAVLLAVAAVQTACLLGIVGAACGFQGAWWTLWVLLYAAALVGGVLGLVISATLQTSEAAAGVLPILLLPMIVLGGILVPLEDLPAATRPFAAVMPSRWAFEGLVVTEAEARPRVRHEAPPAADETPATPVDGESARADGDAVSTRVPITLVSGGSRRFLLPGRRRIAEALEDAAGRAETELRRAEAAAEQKAADMQRRMQADVETRAAELQQSMQTEMERAAAASRGEVERAMRASQVEVERRVQASQADVERKATEMNEAVERQVEEKMREANAALEARLRELQDGMEAERARMATVLERLGGQPAEVVPAEAARAATDVDMAERFFPRPAWRATTGVPLAVLGGMIAAGVALTGLVLRRRDATGR
jgi:ABC-type multidrug transport system ATPase subunit/pSer/pThr/pTyr-binding forkhead associated (FHA) protein